MTQSDIAIAFNWGTFAGELMAYFLLLKCMLCHTHTRERAKQANKAMVDT